MTQTCCDGYRSARLEPYWLSASAVVLRHYGLTFDELRDGDNIPRRKLARYALVYVMRKHTDAPMTWIGPKCGYGSHVSAFDAERAATKMIETDDEFRGLIATACRAARGATESAPVPEEAAR